MLQNMQEWMKQVEIEKFGQEMGEDSEWGVWMDETGTKPVSMHLIDMRTGELVFYAQIQVEED